MSEEHIYNVVIGTAGHIDHGKSSLVRRLTGVDPDRLPEERERGLTIDLGFAPFELPDGDRVGVIDVPGHERFIKNMVAGASGIDLVLLVVAADDSVMPQTREHLDIMTLLGLRHGLIALNKIDLVEPDLIELVEEELHELVQGTFLEGAPIVRVSAVEGTGLDALREQLVAAIQALPGRSVGGVFRMPIQRVFSAKGFGTVVTGVPVSGEVRIGDRLEVLPGGESGRVRGLQAYKATVTRARAGHSTAINLSDLDYHSVHRGMVVATPGYFSPTTMVEARVRVLPGLEVPVRHQQAVRFHTGTVEAVGRIYLLDQRVAEPGAETYAQFRLTEPIVVAPGDRYVFRQESPMLTLGGGEILDRSAWRLKLGKAYVLEALKRKEEALGSQEDFVLSVLEANPFEITDRKGVARLAGLPDADAERVLTTLRERSVLVELSGGALVTRIGLDQAGRRLTHALEECYRDNPYRHRVPKLEVVARSRLASEFLDRVLPWLEAEGLITAHRGGTLELPGRRIELKPAEQRAYEGIEAAFRSQPFAPPRLEDLAQSRGESLELLGRMQDLLIDEEHLVRVHAEVTLHRTAIERAAERLRELFREEGPFTAARAKDVLETTRKYAIPLLEHLDKLKITRRQGELREAP